MIISMNRKQAFDLLRTYMISANLIKHSLATESCMRALATRLGENVEKWGICGLVHDIDYELVKSDMKKHGLEGARILKEHGFDNEICEAVLSHNWENGIPPSSLMGKALYCVDPLTGLIVAATLVLPSKSLSDLKLENLLNRFREKNFAKGARREVILKCEEYFNIDLKDFCHVCLKAMKSISEDIGL